MSEKIYAALLRLFPSGFREAHGEEALQLFRDRARHEKGFFPTVRLWLDLFADLLVAIPREYRRAQPALVGASVEQHVDGAPTFFVLGGESPRASALIFGCVLSLAALSVFSILLGRLGNHRRQGASAAQQQHAGNAQRSSVGAQRGSGSGENARLGTSNVRQWPAAGAAGSGQIDGRPDAGDPNPPAAPENARSLLAEAQQTRDPNTIVIRAAAADLDPLERQRVMDAVVSNLRAHYFDPGVGRKMADALLERERRGDYNVVTDGDAFARLLTRQMRDVSQDRHVEVVYSANPLPERPPEPSPETLARYRQELQQENCTFEKIEILPHNIGYLKLNSFPDPAICEAKAKSAIASLNHADAIIFDLRDNRGGYAGMVSLIAAPLFDHPEYLYDPRFGPTTESWTSSPVAGSQLADKPVYVLTSSSTISAAEQFCYNLKMLKRATLVGETTHGSAHAGVWYRVDEHFGMGVPEIKSINPYGKADWEGTGVDPDVKVKAGDALETAKKLAAGKLPKN